MAHAKTALPALALALLAPLVLVACGDPGPGAVGPGGPATERSADPTVVAARRALDLRHAAQARALVAECAVAAGSEAPVLRGRLLDLEGDLFGALGELRRAQEALPADPRPAAALVEVLAWRGRLEDAARELEAARAVHGRVPELVRAQGVLGICTPGAAATGLELLLEAERSAPDLPFLGRALGEGHLLAAHAALARAEVDRAAEHARACLAHLGDDPRAREALADALVTGEDLERAVELYEELLAEGLPVREKLVNALHNTATAAMVTALGLPPELRGENDLDRERWYLRMLELGVPREDLGHGRSFLERRADALADEAIEGLDRVATLSGLRARLVERGLDTAEVDQQASALRTGARAAVERALALDPHSFKARAVHGELLFDDGDYQVAAQVFEGICNDAAGRLDELAVPIHVSASRAWARAGDEGRARDALLAYLAANPSGRWEEATHAALADLR